jgi:hypothetical protein
MANNEALTIKFGVDLSEFKQKMADAQQSLTSAEAAFNSLKSAAAENPALKKTEEFQQAKESVTQLSTAVKSLKADFAGLTNALNFLDGGKVSKQFKDVISNADAATAAIRRFNESYNSSGRSPASIDNSAGMLPRQGFLHSDAMPAERGGDQGGQGRGASWKVNPNLLPDLDVSRGGEVAEASRARLEARLLRSMHAVEIDLDGIPRVFPP